MERVKCDSHTGNAVKVLAPILSSGGQYLRNDGAFCGRIWSAIKLTRGNSHEGAIGATRA